jgi:dephospho-CoA kinase
MLRVGVTGGAASGKSTVTALLAERGFPVIDADRVAHDLYVPGSPVTASLAAAFGKEILDPAGGIDRDALGARVFGFPERLRILDGIVHPPLLDALAARLDAMEAGGAAAGVLEAALLLHWGPPGFVNVIVGVVASRETRRARMIAKGLSPEQVDARLRSQADWEHLSEQVDIVIDNNGDLAALAREVDSLADALLRSTDGDAGPSGA